MLQRLSDRVRRGSSASANGDKEDGGTAGAGAAPGVAAAPMRTVGEADDFADDPRGAPPKPSVTKKGQQTSWTVDMRFVDAGAREVPSSPDDVDETTRLVFQSKLPNPDKAGEGAWVDFDLACFELGRALGVFALDAKFEQFKWVFWTDNALGVKLINLCKALARDETGCLVLDEAEFKFKRKFGGF